MTLRKRVEKLLPNWESWYPSLFDAACDLGVLRARVCAPDSLLLQSRHASIRAEARQMHRERWGGNEDGMPAPRRVPGRREKRGRRQ